MKKLYLFGDSFSMIPIGTTEYSLENWMENNSPSSLSNDHILKLVKLKLLKLIKNKEKTNIFIQLTVPNRLLLNYSQKMNFLLKNISDFDYNYTPLIYADLELFEKKRYISLYPFLGTFKDDLIKNLYVPYIDYIIDDNYVNLIKDWVLEIEILKNLANSNDINLEYAFFTNDYDSILKRNETNSFHIKFGEYNSIETYLRSSGNQTLFVSRMDKHLNKTGLMWYADFLKNRYDI